MKLLVSCSEYNHMSCCPPLPSKIKSCFSPEYERSDCVSPSGHPLKTAAPTCALHPTSSTTWTTHVSTPPTALKLWSQSKVLALNTLYRSELNRCNVLSEKLSLSISAVVSKPEISFAILKEGPRNYSVTITCQSSEGTPPIAFSLYNSTQLVANMTADDRYATFKVPLVLSQHMGWFACQANNGNRTAYSERIPIEIGGYRHKPQQMSACVYKPGD